MRARVSNEVEDILLAVSGERRALRAAAFFNFLTRLGLDATLTASHRTNK